MDAKEYNQKLDEQLKTAGVVDKELFLKFREAYSYSVASSVGWLEAKLRVLYWRLSRGEHITAYEPSSEQTIELSNHDELVGWVERNFPGVRLP